VKSADWPRSPAIRLFPLYSIAPSDLSISLADLSPELEASVSRALPEGYLLIREERINARSAGTENRNEGEAELRAIRDTSNLYFLLLSPSLHPPLSLSLPHSSSLRSAFSFLRAHSLPNKNSPRCPAGLSGSGGRRRGGGT